MTTKPLICLRTARAKQGGAALVVGLILLMVLTILAISGMNTSTLELQMAGNMQFSANAFHFAERGLDVAMTRPTPPPIPTEPVIVAEVAVDPSAPNEKYGYRIDHSAQTGTTYVPDGGSEMGGPSGVMAWHYEITSTGRSSRNSVAVHTQSYYRKGGSTATGF